MSQLVDPPTLSQQSTNQQQPSIVDTYPDPQDQSLWLKVFLIDSTLNENSWKLKDEFINKNVQNFVGKPFILTKDKAHPDFVKEGVVFGKGDETLNQILTAQSKYKIGEIKKVDSTGNQWFAYVQITEPKIIDSFKQGNIPKFVSPAIYDPTGEPDGSKVKDFSPIHIAAVDQPAYGLKAYVRGACEGEATKCLNELKSATITKSDCPCSILETFTNKFNSDKKESSSYLKNAALVKDSLSQLEKPESIIAEITPQIETSKLESDTNPSSLPTQQQPDLQNPPQPTEIEQVEKRGRKSTAQELVSEVEALKQQLSQITEWQKGEQEKAVKAAAEQQRSAIEQAISPEFAGGDEEKRKQVIDFIVGLNVSNEQLPTLLGLVDNKSAAPKPKPPQQQGEQVKSASINSLILNQKVPQTPKNTYFSSGFFGEL